MDAEPGPARLQIAAGDDAAAVVPLVKRRRSARVEAPRRAREAVLVRVGRERYLEGVRPDGKAGRREERGEGPVRDRERDLPFVPGALERAHLHAGTRRAAV